MMESTGYRVLIDGTADEIRVANMPAAQAVSNRYGRRVSVFCRWSGKYVGDLAPEVTSEGH